MSEVFNFVHWLVLANVALAGAVVTLFFWKKGEEQKHNMFISMVMTAVVLAFLQIFRIV